MPIAEPKNNLLSVLKDRINVIHYLCERLATIYGDQESHARLLAAVRRGVRHLDPILAMMPQENWQNVLDVNLGGTYKLFKLAVQRMLRKRYGRLIAISSISGRIGIERQICIESRRIKKYM